jgi:nucleotide-binding universal stress UspA family protein
MYRFRRIAVVLELDEMDQELIRYAGLIARLAKTEKAYFLHVASSLEIPEIIRQSYPELSKPVDESAKRQCQLEVRQYFDGHSDTEFSCEIVEGEELDQILRLIPRKDIDLILVRRKGEEKSSLMLAEKLARKAPCSILILPEGTDANLFRILVAVDFTEDSRNALEVAIAFASAARLSAIHCLHVYDVPAGYYKTGKSFEQFSDIMEKNAAREYREFVEKFDLKGVSIKPQFVLDKKTSKAIARSIDKGGFDLLIVGSRGRSSGAAILLGALTERLIASTDIPLLAVKKKGECLSFLDAVLEL